MRITPQRSPVVRNVSRVNAGIVREFLKESYIQTHFTVRSISFSFFRSSPAYKYNYKDRMTCFLKVWLICVINVSDCNWYVKEKERLTGNTVVAKRCCCNLTAPRQGYICGRGSNSDQSTHTYVAVSGAASVSFGVRDREGSTMAPPRHTRGTTTRAALLKHALQNWSHRGGGTTKSSMLKLPARAPTLRAKVRSANDTRKERSSK